MMEIEHMLAERRDSVLVALFKKKADIQNGGNYPGIKHISNDLKLWEKIIDSRLTHTRTYTQIHIDR